MRRRIRHVHTASCPSTNLCPSPRSGGAATSKTSMKGSRGRAIASREKPNEAFVLDLGATKVSVEFGELHESAQAVALIGDRRIVLDARRVGEQNLMPALWHELLHHIDDLFLPEYLGGKTDESPEHLKMDVLANCIDMILSRNWESFRELYDAKHRRGGKL